MSSDELRRRLTPMDAFFLYAERSEQPMHVGATCIFEGKISHRDFMRHIGTRLHLIPRYMQRVVPAPLNLGHPTWEDDPDFDLKNHIFRVSLKGTKDDEELRTLSGKIFTGTLDRNKPLWEVYLVEGLSGNRTAMVFKVHHCMVDGVAGIGLAYIAFDMTPEPVILKKQVFKAPPMPDTSTLLYDALWDNAIDGIEHWARFQRSVVNFGRGFEAADVARAIKKFAATMTSFLLPYTKTPFNGPLSPDRHVSWLMLPFADVRAVRVAAGGTVNDVILACLGTALAKFMKDRGDEKKTPRSLRVLVPVNVRQEHERAALGNRISFMPVEVPIHLEDPIEILQAVHLNTKDLKDAKVPESVGLMFEALQGAPAPLQALALNSAANPMVQGLLSYITAMPPANMICTNVPGPNIPLYVMGKRLSAMYPKVPVVMEMGINLALTSYNQKLFLCFCSDGRSGQYADEFRDCFQESFERLRELAEVKTADYVRITRGARSEVETAGAAAAATVEPQTTANAEQSDGKSAAEKPHAQAPRKVRAPRKAAAKRKTAPAAAKVRAAEKAAPKKRGRKPKIHVEAAIAAPANNGHAAQANGHGTPRIHATGKPK